MSAAARDGVPEEVEGRALVLGSSLADAVRGEGLGILENEILPAYVARRRWFGAKDEAITGVRLARVLPLPGGEDLRLTELAVTTTGGTAAYALPLGIAWEGEPQAPFASDLALARVQRGGTAGLLTDGFALTAFPAAVIGALRRDQTVAAGDAVLRFLGAPALDIRPDAPARWLTAEQSNSSLVLDGRAVLKLLRKIQPGVHPDAEMVRQLVAGGFANTPEILGEVWLDAEGETRLLMLVQRFVPNKGDGWGWTLAMLERIVGGDEGGLSEYQTFARTFGRRLAEMHAVLAAPSIDPAFAPEPMTQAEAESLSARVEGQLDKALRLLGGAPLDGDDTRKQAAALKDRRRDLMDRIRTVARGAEGHLRTRIHGDLHLGQVLVTENDVMIIDFEGEPAKPLAERRGKDVPLRDVAGVLRSFDYAAAVAARTAPSDQRCAAFRDAATRAFLEGYMGQQHRGQAEPGGAPVLDLFLLEKAAYEIAYEAANRPDWIGIPLAGLAGAAGRLLNGSPA